MLKTVDTLFGSPCECCQVCGVAAGDAEIAVSPYLLCIKSIWLVINLISCLEESTVTHNRPKLKKMNDIDNTSATSESRGQWGIVPPKVSQS